MLNVQQFLLCLKAKSLVGVDKSFGITPIAYTNNSVITGAGEKSR
jgi:hypothetical protein